MKFLKEIIPYIIVIIIVVIIRTFLITPVKVSGPSMFPTLEDGEVMLLNKITLSFNNIKRFDIIVLQYEDKPLVKRVIGLPGEMIEYKNGSLYVNDKKVTDSHGYGSTNNFTLKDLQYDIIPDDMYLVLGDNREVSADSRVIGLVEKNDIKGKTNMVIWPLDKFGLKK